MRFDRLDLIKYGKFSDRPIGFPAAKQDFHLIVGPNEAGKSTVRSAILDLLFGIPTRSPLGFLHPLNELRLGAAISGHAGSLEFHRAKAQKQTLRSHADAVLANTALTPFLGAADRNFFDQMFGLDHTRLIDGGNSILSAENDVGQVLFQSAAGVASLGKVRDALIAEADKLWSPRKSADRAYYIAAGQLDEAASALKEATVRTKVWAEASSKVEALQEALAGEREHHRQLQVQRGRLERIRRVAPFLRAVRENDSRLAALGAVVDLPADAAATLDAAERELATASKLLEVRNEEVRKATDDLARIEIDESVLAMAADITRLEQLRQQYSPYERDIERLETEVAAQWREVSDACAQLGWKSGSARELSERLPTLLVRRELGRLVRDHGALAQALRAAEQAERTKASEIESLSRQLAALQSGAVSPALRAALAGARPIGDPDAAIRKQQETLARATAELEAALQALGPWRSAIPALRSMQPPSQQTLSRLAQERQALKAERKAASQQRDDRQAGVARIELEIAQFNALHHPTTHEAVVHARRERDASWGALRSDGIALEQGAQKFETQMLHADAIADARLDNVEEATALQSQLHALEREKQSVAHAEDQCARLNEALRQFGARWSASTAGLGLAELSLEDIGDWLARRERALAAASAVQEAQESFEAVSRTVSEARLGLADALREAGLQLGQVDGLSTLCVQAESFIQAIDGAAVRRETLSAQLHAAQALAATLGQATGEARALLEQWQEAWSRALAAAGLSATSDTGTAEGALGLIDLIAEKLAKMRQIRVERIDAMQADLEKFAADAAQVARSAAPESSDLSSARIAQELAARLGKAREAQAEAGRLKEALRIAGAQVAQARESIHLATATLRPLMERAGAASNAALAAAIARSDEQRRLGAELASARTNLLDGGDGLTREQIESEVDAADLAQLLVELGAVNDELGAAVKRQETLSADLANARRALAEIGGSDAAARAEARRQEALARMSDAAERYVKVYTAGRLLRWAIDRYREEKQGPTLARAGAIFSKLTLGSFQRLIVDFDKEPMALEGQRTDGKLVGISGMSDGTRDQLYLALRLAALELHLEQALPLPFIADDLFINYDDARARAGLEVLAGISERTQVIFLSHHDHLVPAVQDVFGERVNIVLL